MNPRHLFEMLYFCVALMLASALCAYATLVNLSLVQAQKTARVGNKPLGDSISMPFVVVDRARRLTMATDHQQQR